MNITAEKLQSILEAAIMAAGRPLTPSIMQKLFDEGDEPEISEIKNALVAIQSKYQTCGIELKEVASGYQFQAKTEFSHWLSRLWEERAPRYSRAFLETLALIAYRQPVTRAEIEEIRGVTASSHILKTLQEREWIRVLGYKEVPGKPALYGTTKTFLDYFNLRSLDELPTLAELKDLASQEAKLQVEIDFENGKKETTVEIDENATSPAQDSQKQDNQKTENKTSLGQDKSEFTEFDTENVIEINPIKSSEFTENEIDIVNENITPPVQDEPEFSTSDTEAEIEVLTTETEELSENDTPSIQEESPLTESDIETAIETASTE
jgi:segregation and condensation protein B